MKTLALGLILYIVAFIGFGLTTQQTFAAVSCQVTYGGGEVCQNQPAKQFTYPAPQPTQAPSPTPAPIDTNAGLSNLPSTGASWLSYALIVASAAAGILIKIFLI